MRSLGERVGRIVYPASQGSAAALVLLLAWAPDAVGLSFGPSGAFELRGRIYSQVSIATEDSPRFIQPALDAGRLKQWRTFWNPELEVDLVKLFELGSVDRLEVRLAGWGFYDGIYDFGPPRWRRRLRRLRRAGGAEDGRLFTTATSARAALALEGRRVDGRRLYGSRGRLNEAYLNFEKGDLFIRVGRQAISWGEADTIGLLDANNPFDVLIQPGLLIDLDEARIPLWTLRTTYALFDRLGPWSDGFVDAYFVPGWIDATVGFLPVPGLSPYAPSAPTPGRNQQVVDLRPRKTGRNSRWGIRAQSVLWDEYTVSVWFYRSFSLVPMPRGVGVSQPAATGEGLLTTVVERRLTNVWGAALSWYAMPIDTVLRMELELFQGEPVFLAHRAIGLPAETGFAAPGTTDRANVLRGEIGFDRNFRVGWLNPGGSFFSIVSVVFEANLDERSGRDHRAPILKPTALRREAEGGEPAGFFSGEACDDDRDSRPCDFVDQDPFEAFLQATVRTEYLHGDLTVQTTGILNTRGAFTFAPTFVYRWSDMVSFDLKYVWTETFGSGNDGFTRGGGLQLGRDQLWARVTLQLN